MKQALWTGVMRVGPIGTNCYFLKNGKEGDEIVLVDPGDEPEQILEEVRRQKAKVAAVLLTHAHYDHILAVPAVKREWPEAPVMILKDERSMLTDSRLNTSFIQTDVTVTPDRYLSDGDVLTLLEREIRVMASPGHTAGSCCYYVPSDAALFAGDTVFRGSYGRTDLPTGSPEAMADTLEKLLTALPPDTAVYPGHGPGTTIGRERLAEGF